MQNNKNFTFHFMMPTRIVVFAFLFSSVFSACKSHKPASTAPNPKAPAVYDHRKMDYLFFEGLNNKQKGNLAEALENFKGCLLINPTSDATLYEIAKILQGIGRNNEALPIIKRAVALDDKNIWYQLQLADCLRTAGKLMEAAQVYQNLIKLQPDNVDFYNSLANTYIYAQKPEEAIKVYDKLEEKFGIVEDYSIQKLSIYNLMRKPEKAIIELQKLIDWNPKESKYYLRIAQQYLEMGDKAKAFETYKKVEELDPGNPHLHLGYSDYYREMDQKEKSFQELRIAFRNPSLTIETKVNILQNFFNYAQNNPDLHLESDSLSAIILKVHPNEALAHYARAGFYYQDRKPKEARDEYRESARLDKNKFEIWNQVLTLDDELKDYTSLEKESDEVIELFPTDPRPYLFKGFAQVQLKKYTEAIESLNQGKEYVVDNKPLLVSFYTSLGDAHNANKNYQASDKAYEKALEFDPKNILVLNNYSYYLSLRKDKLDLAEKMAKKANELEPNVGTYNDTYGWVLYVMGKYSEAKVWIGKAIENGGSNDPDVLEHYGDVLYKLNNLADALNYWKKAKDAGSTSEKLEKKLTDKKIYE
jgi:tetratricopeptide (TPR) repeat protein